MKAWLVREKDAFCAEVVFAETRGKARALARRTGCYEDARLTDIKEHCDRCKGNLADMEDV